MRTALRFASAALSLALAAGLLFCGPAPSQAQEMLRAAAVVNDEIISVFDLNMRIRLATLATRQQDTPELQQRVVSQVMRSLIDERLQAQEAQRLDISVSEDDLKAAIDRIAQSNNMTTEAFVAIVEERGIPKESLHEQVRAQMIWLSLINRRLRPSVQVSDEEVQDIVDRIVANRGTTMRRVSEIFLAVDSVLQEDDVRTNSERLLQQLRAGAEFAALARQFSQSATAPQGGDIGWVQEGQLPPEIDAVLATMGDRTVAGPVRTPSGYHILLLREQRQAPLGDVTMHLRQVLFSLPSEATPAQKQEASSRAAAVRERISSCDDVEAVAGDTGVTGSGDLGAVKMSDLPPAIQESVRSLPIGQPSEPIPVADGLSVLVVCERADIGIDRNAIREQLVTEQLDLLARRYMRDLRRKANVDIRI